MSDEQRKREREKELRRQVREPWLAFSEKHRESLSTNELFFLREGYEAAWIQRDAEVQALKAALTTAQDALLKVGHRLAKVHEDADGAEIALDAHYATQKTEGKAADAD